MYNFDFSWLYNTVFPKLGEVVSYIIALGEIDVVVVEYVLMGNNFEWFALNIFTGETMYLNLPSYGVLLEALKNVPAPVITYLVEFLDGGLEQFGHILYMLFFYYPSGSFVDWLPPINVPLWLGLLLAYPRIKLLGFVFNAFSSFIKNVFSAF